MTSLFPPALPLFLASTLALAGQGITFGPVRAQPGESIRLISQSTSDGGTVEMTRDSRTVRGTLRMSRERDLSWTFRDPAPDGSRRGMVSVARIASSTTMKLDGREEKSEDASPLNGKMFAMTKAPAGDWKFELDGSVPLRRIRKEIEELTVYLKRQWYPQRMVKVGDSWEFDPAWIRMIIEKDLHKAQTIGTMKLRQVRRSVGKDVAVIDVSVRSTGADFQADGSEAKAQVELSGQIMVDLRTMLDESLELKGTVVSSSGKIGDSKKVTLPVHLVVKKSFVRDFGNP
jgi:hypothetical protein